MQHIVWDHWVQNRNCYTKLTVQCAETWNIALSDPPNCVLIELFDMQAAGPTYIFWLANISVSITIIIIKFIL